MNIKAPMSGNVWKIVVKVNEAVKKNDVLIIMESMKMEIPVEAEGDGIVAKIVVSEADFIQEDDLLIVLE